MDPHAAPPDTLPPYVAPASNVSHADPHSVCHLRFLMVNGESFRLTIPLLSSVYQVKQMVITECPKELLDFLRESTPSITTMPTKVEEIRILHFGKFLDDTKTLKDYNFATGTDNQTTVHISVRIMGAVSEDVKEKMNKKSGACCVIM